MVKNRHIKRVIRELHKLRKNTPSVSKAHYPKKAMLCAKIKTLEMCLGTGEKKIRKMYDENLKGLLENPHDMILSSKDEAFAWVLQVKDNFINEMTEGWL